jgi:hypothetical protein
LNLLIDQDLMTAVAVFAVCVSALAGTEAQRGGDDRAMSTYASCHDQSTGKLIGSRKSRTAVLVSADRRFRAYAESEATASETTDASIPQCQNISKLFVAESADQKFRVVLELKPSVEALGNSIGLIDWSPSGHRLLVAQDSWQYGSDAGETAARIYDGDTLKLSTNGFVEEAFRRKFGRKCIGVFQPVSFSREGGAVIKAGPYFDVGDDEPLTESCIRKEGLWEVDPATLVVHQLAPSYRVRHYGRVVPGNP